MTASLPYKAPHKNLPQELAYGYDNQTGQFIFQEGDLSLQEGSSEELLTLSENYDIPEEHRGSLLMGIPFLGS